MRERDAPSVGKPRVDTVATVEKAQSVGLLFAVSDRSKAAFNDARVRQPFFHALDMDQINGAGASYTSYLKYPRKSDSDGIRVM